MYRKNSSDDKVCATSPDIYFMTTQDLKEESAGWVWLHSPRPQCWEAVGKGSQLPAQSGQLRDLLRIHLEIKMKSTGDVGLIFSTTHTHKLAWGLFKGQTRAKSKNWLNKPKGITQLFHAYISKRNDPGECWAFTKRCKLYLVNWSLPSYWWPQKVGKLYLCYSFCSRDANKTCIFLWKDYKRSCFYITLVKLVILKALVSLNTSSLIIYLNPLY